MFVSSVGVATSDVTAAENEVDEADGDDGSTDATDSADSETMTDSVSGIAERQRDGQEIPNRLTPGVETALSQGPFAEAGTRAADRTAADD